MKKSLIAVFLLVIIGGFATYQAVKPPKPPSSQAFINATVITMDSGHPIAEAVFLKGNRIEAVGSNREIQALVETDTVVHDLQGKTLLPGFIDAHGHYPGSGLNAIALNLGSPPIGAISSMEQLLDAVKERALSSNSGKWVLGMGYDDTLLREKRHPTRAELDTVAPDHPVVLIHTSGHLAVANSKALEVAGIDESTPNPEGGVYVKDQAGRLTGLLEETAAMDLQLQAADIGAGEFLSMIEFASAEYASQGVTLAQSGATTQEAALGLSLASHLGMIPFRLELWPMFDLWGEELLQNPDSAQRYENDRLNIGAVKIVADGSIQGYTGYLSKPYHHPFHGDEQYRGYPRVPRGQLFEWVEKFHAAGMQMAIHGNGDAAMDDIIAAFSEAQRKYPNPDPRLILIHAQMARDDQLVAMKELGITPSFFSAHTYYWGDRHRDIFMGPERAANMSPTRSALDLGLPFTVHLDTPVVPMSPLMGVWSTVNRQTRSGQVLGEHQQIPVMDALRAVTLDAAWQIFREKDLGSIEPGKLADLVVLGENPLDNADTIKDIQVEQTYVGGVRVFNLASAHP